MPSQEGFEGFDGPCGEVDERLIVHGEFVVFEGAPEIAVELVAVDEFALHMPGESLDGSRPWDFATYIAMSARRAVRRRRGRRERCGRCQSRRETKTSRPST